MDVVALAQFGVGYAVATLGTATTETHVSKLLRLTDEIVFCFDGDAAGRKAAWRALEVCMPLVTDAKPIKFLFLPQEHDPDSYIREKGKADFEERVRGAETLSQFFLSRLRAESDLATAEGRAKFSADAKPYVQKITAPNLRVQLVNEIAELARVSEAGIAELMNLPRAPGFRRAAPPKSNVGAPDYVEWHLLVGVLGNLALAEQVDPQMLDASLPETEALVAIQDACRDMEATATLGQIMERLDGHAWTPVLLRAHKFCEEVAFTPEQATSQFSDALRQLDLRRLKKELDELRSGGLRSREEQIAFRDKNLAYKRLQGALPSP
jgi:DNA primase